MNSGVRYAGSGEGLGPGLVGIPRANAPLRVHCSRCSCAGEHRPCRCAAKSPTPGLDPRPLPSRPPTDLTPLPASLRSRPRPRCPRQAESTKNASPFAHFVESWIFASLTSFSPVENVHGYTFIPLSILLMFRRIQFTNTDFFFFSSTVKSHRALISLCGQIDHYFTGQRSTSNLLRCCVLLMWLQSTCSKLPERYLQNRVGIYLR